MCGCYIYSLMQGCQWELMFKVQVYKLHSSDSHRTGLPQCSGLQPGPHEPHGILPGGIQLYFWGHKLSGGDAQLEIHSGSCCMCCCLSWTGEMLVGDSLGRVLRCSHHKLQTLKWLPFYHSLHVMYVCQILVCVRMFIAQETGTRHTSSDR